MRTRSIFATAGTLGAFCLGLLLPSLPMRAQTDVPDNDEGYRIKFGSTAKDREIYEILKKDRPKQVNEVPVPHFAIYTANKKFVLTIGAKVNPIIGVDMGSDLYDMSGAGINFITSQIRVPAAAGKKSDFYINALNAIVDFQCVGFGGTANQITGYIKLKTNGNDHNVYIDKAFLTWRGLTAGLKTSLFTTDEAFPNTIDPQGPNGLVSVTVNEFAYITPSFKGFQFGIGLDKPSYYASTGVYLGDDYRVWKGHEIAGDTVCDPTYYSMTVPDIPLMVQYSKGGNIFKLGGLIRPMIYRDVLAAKRKCTVGWALSANAIFKAADPLKVYLQANYGKGYGNFIQDLAGTPISWVPKNDDPGEMTPTPMLSWCAGLTWQINSKWQANLIASQVRVWNASSYAEAEAEGETGEINNYKSGFYGCANLFYNISSYFQVGIEYLYGYRKSWDAGSGHDNRLQMRVQFTL